MPENNEQMNSDELPPLMKQLKAEPPFPKMIREILGAKNQDGETLGQVLRYLPPVYPSDVNSVSVFVPKGDRYGGAHTYYCVPSLGFENGKAVYNFRHPTIEVPFVRKIDGALTLPGLQSEQLLIILLDRHERLNAVYPSAHHEKFMTGVRMALEALKERVDDRMGRGVMGQLKP